MASERWYRPDIQALRAFAVLAVLAYHLGVPGTSGGFVGVDVFFVVSGYLITRLLLEEHRRSGTIDLLDFTARRVRRLLPASVLVLAVSSGALVIMAGALRRAREAAVLRAAALFHANVALAAQEADYHTAGQESVIQHYWSLGVEEQFYVLWPALLLGAILLARRLGRSRLEGAAVLAAVGTAVSLWLVIGWTTTLPSSAFFLLPARAWELLAGAGVATWDLAGRSVQRPVPLQLLGAAAVLWSVVTMDGTRFPWPLAVVPVIGTCFLLAAGVGHASPRWTTWAPLVWVGDRSYGIYLWHWPPLVLLGLAGGAFTDRPVARIGVGVGALAAAALSYRFVEQPMRRLPALRAPRRSGGLGVVLTGLAVVASIGATSVAPVAVPDPDPVVADGGVTPPASTDVVSLVDPVEPVAASSSLRPRPEDAAADRPVSDRDGCHVVAADEPRTDVPCVFGAPDGEVTVALLGDDRAAPWIDALDAVGRDRGWRVLNVTRDGCAPYATDVPCGGWRGNAISRLGSLDVDVVVLAGGADAVDRSDPAEWRRAVEDGIGWVRGVVPTAAVVHVLDGPLPTDDVPACVLAAGAAACGTVVDGDFDRAQRAASVLADAVVDLPGLLCAADRCPAVLGDVLLYRDGVHLSTAATTGPLAGPLVEAIDAARALRDAQWRGTVLPPATVADPDVLTIASQRPALRRFGCHVTNMTWEASSLEDCTFGDPDGRLVVAMIGDSHTDALFPAAEAAAVRHGWKLVAQTRGGCHFFITGTDAPVGEPASSTEACEAFRARTLERMDALEPDVVIIGAVAREGSRRPGASWTTAMREGVAMLQQRLDARVVVALDTPLAPERVPECIEERGAAACAFDSWDSFDESQRAAAHAVADGVVDLPAALCRDGICPAQIGPTIPLRDGDHLSVAGALALSPLLAQAVNAAVAGDPGA